MSVGWETAALLALGGLNLAVLVWLALRKPAPDAGRVELLAALAALAAGQERLERELRREVGESARGGRQELLQTLTGFQDALMRQASENIRTQNAQLDGFAAQLVRLEQANTARLDAMRQQLDERLVQAQADAQAGRRELSEAMAAFRSELGQAVGGLAAETRQSREALTEGAVRADTHIQQRFDTLSQATRNTLESLKADLARQLESMSVGMSTALKDQLEGNGHQIRNQFVVLQDTMSQQLSGLVLGTQQTAEQLRNALNERLLAIQADNTAKLEEMRRTVDEKLHATLEQRLGESFKQVSDRLEQVHKGLGEMQSLASSVGDLKRVMTNVKSRGTWGEVQLGAIIDNVLTPDQYARNVKTVPGSDELVEFAIRLPGRQEQHPVWLPIDSKYPVEHYQRLLDAQEAADKTAVAAAGNAFEVSLRAEAKKIASKYLCPPHTTDFAILYLPTEGLFAEALRRPGLMEALQNECRVMLTGPSNLAAMLNSLQMGFKTLAIEKRSSEVWSLLGQVKSEFAKFGDVVDATKKSIDAAARKFDEVGTRTRAIQRRLRDVQELPSAGSADALLPAPPDEA